MMKKLSILLLVLCLILPAAAMAANPTVKIGDVALPNGYYMATGTNVPVAAKPAGGYAYLKNGVLTLYNYSLTSNVYHLIDICQGALEIKLVGSNRLIGTNSISNGITINENSALTIGGTGSLYIEAHTGIDGYENYNETKITGGKITIREGLWGIYLYGPLTISGGEVSVVAREPIDDEDNPTAIVVWAPISVTGGKLSAKADFMGIMTDQLTVSGGEVHVTGETDCAIQATSAYISGGKATFVSTESVAVVGDMLSITGGTVAITADNRSFLSDILRIGGTNTVVDMIRTNSDSDYGILDIPDELRIDSPMAILEPEGGVIGTQVLYDMESYTILNADGTHPTHVRIANPNPPAPAVPATGDASSLTLWLVLAALAMAGAVLLRKRAYR